MAEQLGEASLRIVVDDSALRQGLADAKALVERELGGTFQQAGQRATRGGRAGGGRVGRQAAEGINSEIAANRTLRQLRSNLNRLEAAGVNTVQLRTRYFQIEKQIADGLFGSARRNSDLLKQSIADEKIRLDLQRQQAKAVDAAAKSGRGTGPSSPIRGNRLIPGSPANIEFLARQGGPTSPIRGGAAFPGSPIALEKAAAAERKLAREREAGATATLKAAARERKARTDRFRDIAANALIGAGFPLLFGQGAGAAAGGAIGGGLGALGGGTFGFAGSIAGTALGAAFDTALEKGRQLAIGLEDPIKNFEALRQAAVLSSRAVERNAEALIAAGREEEAAALIRQDLLKTFGTTQGYEEFAKATDELNRSFSQATVALAQFVAGPLAEFLRTISTGLGGGAAIRFAQENAGRAREIIQANPAQGRRFRQLAQQRGLEIDENLAVNSRDLAARNKLVEEFLRLNGEQTAQQKQQTENEKEMNAAMASGNKLKELSARLALEQARGNELSAAQAERELIAAEKRTKLNLLPREATATQRRLVSESFTEREVANAERIRTAQEKINTAAFDEQQRRDAINASISNTVSLLGINNGEYRQSLQLVQGIQTSIEESRRKEAELGFKIDQARLGGREEEAAQLVDRQRTAALESRQKLIEGAQALTDASERLRDNLRNAVLEFTRIRSDPQGLNRFLSQQARNRRAEQDFRLLLPQFRQAQQTFTALTGERAPEFTGPTAGVNKAIRDFIEKVQAESGAQTNLEDTNRALFEVNKALISSNLTLAGATQALVEKNWTIDIQVVNQAGGASTVNAVNGLAQ